MGQIVSFEDYVPPERFDAVPWTQARIYEASAVGGPWALIDTVSLGAADPDPADPAPRNFTTILGTGPDLWYRVVFFDVDNNVSEPTTPEQNLGIGTTSDGGPCQLWITGDDVAECCGIPPGSDTDAELHAAADMATTVLYRLTARKFNGSCVRILRPCRSGCACSHVGEGWYWRGSDWATREGRACGCGCVNQVTLSGKVRTIVEVKIDGDVVPVGEYRLDESKYLVRMADADGNRQAWPRCQRLDLDSTEEGTFEITYLAGTDPPPAGVAAAKSLACELFKGCNGGDCALPTGVTRIIRQGLTIEKIDSLGMMLRRGATGLPLVDSFIAVFNPTGALLGPAIWSPDMPAHRRMA